MDINGAIALFGSSNELVLIENEPATDTAAGSDTHRRGIIKFTNGVKMQWDTIDIAADATTVTALHEPYSEAQWCVIGGFGQTVSETANQNDMMCWVPAADSLTTVALRNISSATDEMTYLSIGKDKVPFDGIIDTKALSLDGGEWLETVNKTLGIADEWTIQFNLSRDNATADDYIFNFDSSSNNFSSITCIWSGATANDPIRIIARQANGNGMRDWSFDMASPPIVAAQKYSIVVVWNGALATAESLRCYMDGIELTTITKTSTFSGNQEDAPRQVIFGDLGTNFGSLNGNIHSCSWWNKAFGQAEITAINNGGSPYTMDNRFNKGDYVSSHRLIHYWRFGFDFYSLGRDYGLKPIDAAGTGTTNVTTADIVDY